MRPKYNLAGTTEYLENKRYRKAAEKYMDDLEEKIKQLEEALTDMLLTHHYGEIVEMKINKKDS